MMTTEQPQPDNADNRDKLMKQIASLDLSIARLCLKQNILKIAVHELDAETELESP